MSQYPKGKDPNLIGEYLALVKSGDSYVWDEVLAYRAWCHPENGTPNSEDGDDYYSVFETYEEALKYSEENEGAEKPIALVLQEEYIDEPEPGNYVYVKERRLTEWPIQLLNRPRRNANTILDFVSPNAPSNRLDILRGIA